jgi:hypothetical protein
MAIPLLGMIDGYSLVWRPLAERGLDESLETLQTSGFPIPNLLAKPLTIRS